MCEHFIARAAEPFRLDELWPFTERLERFGLAGFGWGAAWVDGAGRLGVLSRHPRLPRRSGSRARRPDRDDVRAGPPPAAVAAVDADPARHPAVRRPGRPVLVQPQRRPRATTGPSARRTGSRAASTAAPTPRSVPAGSRTPGDRTSPRPHLLAALHDRFGGQANLAVLAPTGAAHHYAGNTENPVFSFRLGPDRRRVDRPLFARSVAVPVCGRGRDRAATRPPADHRRSRPRREALRGRLGWRGGSLRHADRADASGLRWLTSLERTDDRRPRRDRPRRQRRTAAPSTGSRTASSSASRSTGSACRRSSPGSATSWRAASSSPAWSTRPAPGGRCSSSRSAARSSRSSSSRRSGRSPTTRSLAGVVASRTSSSARCSISSSWSGSPTATRSSPSRRSSPFSSSARTSRRDRSRDTCRTSCRPPRSGRRALSSA